MKRKNRYVFRSKIPEGKFRQVLKYFCMDIEALKIASLTALNRNTINRIVKGLRKRMLEECERTPGYLFMKPDPDWERFHGQISGHEGRAASSKAPVFGLISNQGDIYLQIGTEFESSREDGLREAGNGKDGIEDTVAARYWRDFLSYAELRMIKFKGIASPSYELHLKESEFRFNHRNQNLYRVLLKLFRSHPLFAPTEKASDGPDVHAKRGSRN